MSRHEPLPNHTCPLCDSANQCAPAMSGTFATPCWCREIAIDPGTLARVPHAQRLRSCLCPRCAATKG